MSIGPAPPVPTNSYNIPTFILAAAALLYLSTFVVFAALQVITGISIQRVGYFSLRRITFEPRQGLKIEIRKLGLLLHRPTFAQPTWLSLVLHDSHVALDLRKPAPGDGPARDEATEKAEKGRRSRSKDQSDSAAETPGDLKRRSEVVESARRFKKALKRVHRWIKWIRLVDIAVSNTTVTVVDVGSVQIGSVTMMVDTRQEAAKRNPTFDHSMDFKEGHQPIEWIFVAKSLLLLPEKKDPMELVDIVMFNMYGVVEPGIEKIRDMAIAFKFGRVTLSCDELLSCADKLKLLRKSKSTPAISNPKQTTLNTVVEGATTIRGSRADRVAELVVEGKEILHSFLTNVKEVQFAIGFLEISKEIPNIQPLGKPLQVILGTKELGMDVHQLDRKSPAHKMYGLSKVYLWSLTDHFQVFFAG